MNRILQAGLSGLIGGYVGSWASRRITADWIRETDGPDKRAAIASAIQTMAIVGTFMLLGWDGADPSVSGGVAPAPAVAV